MIYFVGCEHGNAVKIGYTEKRPYLSETATAFERVHVLQIGCPFALELLAICEGGKSEEAELHQRFCNERIRGEWFVFSSALREYVGHFSKPVRGQRGWHGQARNRKAA